MPDATRFGAFLGAFDPDGSPLTSWTNLGGGAWARGKLGETESFALGSLVSFAPPWGCHWSDWVSEDVSTTSKRD